MCIAKQQHMGTLAGMTTGRRAGETDGWKRPGRGGGGGRAQEQQPTISVVYLYLYHSLLCLSVSIFSTQHTLFSMSIEHRGGNGRSKEGGGGSEDPEDRGTGIRIDG